jgi:hypothetical protein
MSVKPLPIFPRLSGSKKRDHDLCSNASKAKTGLLERSTLRYLLFGIIDGREFAHSYVVDSGGEVK